MLRDLFEKSRSYRRFYQDYTVDLSTLRDLVDLARLSPSARNLQPLKYILSADPLKNALVFPNLAWAGYLTDWDGPVEGERPSAYIIILADSLISKTVQWDHGIVCQSMLIGAADKGLGGCIIGSINRENLRKALSIPERYEILLVLALGKPRETVVIEKVGPDGNIRYWRDENQVHHVPKRDLDEMILDL